MPTQHQLLVVRLQALKATLKGASDKVKGELAGTSVVESFNSLRDEVSRLYPDLDAALPPNLSARSRFTGKAEVSYLDVEVHVEQILGLLALVAE